MLACSLRLVMALSLLPAIGGCAPRRPASFDYVPNWKADEINCTQAELMIDGQFPKFEAGQALDRYSDCYTIAVALLKFSSAGGPCPETNINQKYADVDAEAVKAWVAPCEGIFRDANIYAAELQDYTVKEQSNALSWRDALVILTAAALSSR